MTTLTIATPAGPVPGYLAVPPGAGCWPGVVVVHELLGLNDDIRRISDRFATAGYLVFAPDLMADGNRVRCLLALANAARTGRGAPARRLLGCRDWLAARSDCTGKVGIAGFCLGGGFAIVLANQGFDAAAAQYARLPGDLPAAARGACAVAASYGGRDLSLRGAADTLERALDAAGVPNDVKEYPQAGHSFMNRSEGPAWLKPLAAPLRAGYVETAAEDAWERILALFATTLR